MTSRKKFTVKRKCIVLLSTVPSVMLTAAIEARERRDTGVHDVLNAFCQAHNDQKVIMKIKGKEADYLILVDPRLYKKLYSWRMGKLISM